MDKVYEGMSLDELYTQLKREANKISLDDLYQLSYHFSEDSRYLPREYNKKFRKTVLDVIVKRFIDLRNNEHEYRGKLNKNDASNINHLLEIRTPKTSYILNLVVVYVTYLLRQPVHLPDTAFPGKVSIYYEDGVYYCPIKKKHIHTPNSVCKYCIAKPVE
ncbi:MAG: DUF2115 family protein [Methanosphaera sp.]|nr:DUF2115 family protein [Methanosphaera sp.]